MKDEHRKIISENRKARHEYAVVDEYEAGIVLLGTEVKSLRMGRANLKDSYAKIKKGEVFVYQMHVSPCPFAYYGNHDPLRPRKLLLHNSEIKKLIGKVAEKGFSLIPLQLYFKDGKAKMKLALAKGKHLYDKRESIKNGMKKGDGSDQKRFVNRI